MNLDNIDWDKVNGLVPAIVQDFKSSQVLMLELHEKKHLKILSIQILFIFIVVQKNVYGKKVKLPAMFYYLMTFN